MLYNFCYLTRLVNNYSKRRLNRRQRPAVIQTCVRKVIHTLEKVRKLQDQFTFNSRVKFKSLSCRSLAASALAI